MRRSRRRWLQGRTRRNADIALGSESLRRIEPGSTRSTKTFFASAVSSPAGERKPWKRDEVHRLLEFFPRQSCPAPDDRFENLGVGGLPAFCPSPLI